MPETAPGELPRVPSDPQVVEALARELIEVVCAGDRDGLKRFLEDKAPRVRDAIRVTETALQIAVAEKAAPEVTSATEGILKAMREQDRRTEEHLRQVCANGLFSGLERMVYLLREQDGIPADWRTREGDSLCATLWMWDYFQAMKQHSLCKEAGDLVGAKREMLRAHEAIEVAMDRFLTLQPADREDLRGIPQMYQGMMDNKQRNLSSFPDRAFQNAQRAIRDNFPW
jgi:hypothetical protein